MAAADADPGGAGGPAERGPAAHTPVRTGVRGPADPPARDHARAARTGCAASAPATRRPTAAEITAVIDIAPAPGEPSPRMRDGDPAGTGGRRLALRRPAPAVGRSRRARPANALPGRALSCRRRRPAPAAERVAAPSRPAWLCPTQLPGPAVAGCTAHRGRAVVAVPTPAMPTPVVGLAARTSRQPWPSPALPAAVRRVAHGLRRGSACAVSRSHRRSRTQPGHASAASQNPRPHGHAQDNRRPLKRPAGLPLDVPGSCKLLDPGVRSSRTQRWLRRAACRPCACAVCLRSRGAATGPSSLGGSDAARRLRRGSAVAPALVLSQLAPESGLGRPPAPRDPA